MLELDHGATLDANGAPTLATLARIRAQALAIQSWFRVAVIPSAEPTPESFFSQRQQALPILDVGCIRVFETPVRNSASR
jgi:hypothetical protein